MQTAVGKWGNSLAVRLPRAVVEELRLHEGAPVEVRVEAGRLTITPRRPCYRLDDLLAETTRETTHREADWGGPRGGEAW